MFGNCIFFSHLFIYFFVNIIYTFFVVKRKIKFYNKKKILRKKKIELKNKFFE